MLPIPWFIRGIAASGHLYAGAFLSSGSMSDPQKGYHFEIVCPDEETGQTAYRTIIRSFHIDAKIVLRKKSYVVYVKEGAQIVDMLAIMEANVALMDLGEYPNPERNAQFCEPEGKL